MSPENIIRRRCQRDEHRSLCCSSTAGTPSTQTLDSESARGKQTKAGTTFSDNSQSLFSVWWRISELPPPSGNSESLLLFSFCLSYRSTLSSARTYVVFGARAAWMFSGPDFDLPGGILVNPLLLSLPTLTATLIYYSAAILFSPSTLSSVYFLPFLIPEQLLQSPALCLLFILFINLPVFCPLSFFP